MDASLTEGLQRAGWGHFTDLAPSDHVALHYFAYQEGQEEMFLFLDAKRKYDLAFVQLGELGKRLIHYFQTPSDQLKISPPCLSAFSDLVKADCGVVAFRDLEVEMTTLITEKVTAFRKIVGATGGSLLDSFDQVMQDKYMRELFREYLVSKLSSEVLMFYIACLEYESLTGLDQRVRMAQYIWASFFTGHQKMQIAVDFEMKSQVRVALSSGSPDLFVAVKQEQRDCLINFMMDFRSEYSAFLQVEVKQLVKDIFFHLQNSRLIRVNYALPKSIFQLIDLLAEISVSRVAITGLVNEIKRSGISFLDFFDPTDAKASSFSLTHLHVWSCFLPTCSRFLKFQKTDDYQDFVDHATEQEGSHLKGNILNRLSKTLSGRSTAKKKIPAVIDHSSGEMTPSLILPVASHVPYQYSKKKRFSAPNLSTYYSVPVLPEEPSPPTRKATTHPDELKYQEKTSDDKFKRGLSQDELLHMMRNRQGRAHSQPDVSKCPKEPPPQEDQVKRGSSQELKKAVVQVDTVRRGHSEDVIKPGKKTDVLSPRTPESTKSPRSGDPTKSPRGDAKVVVKPLGMDKVFPQRKNTSISPRSQRVLNQKIVPETEGEPKPAAPHVEINIHNVDAVERRTSPPSLRGTKRPKLARWDSSAQSRQMSNSRREERTLEVAEEDTRDNQPLEGGSGGSDESEIRKKLTPTMTMMTSTLGLDPRVGRRTGKRASVDTPAPDPYGLQKVNKFVGSHLIRANELKKTSSHHQHPLLLKNAETKLQSLEYLFSLVIFGGVNSITVSNIILAIPHFMNPTLIIPIIENIYSNHVSDKTSFHTMSLVKQIIIFLSSSYFLKPETSKLLSDLIQKIQKDHSRYGQLLSEFFETHNAQKLCQTLAQQTNKLSTPLGETIRLFNFNLNQLSQQLCIFDQQNFQNIDVSEFHRSKYVKTENSKINILLKLQTNLVSQLVDETVQQTKVVNPNELNNLISLGWKLLQLRNFQSLRAVYLALEKIVAMDPKAFKHVSKKYQGIKETIDLIFNPEGDYNYYWLLLQEQDGKYIPSLELDLIKLQFIQLGPNFLGEKRVDLNTNKIQTMGELISVYIRAQLYEFPAEPDILCVLQAMHDLPTKLKETTPTSPPLVPPTVHEEKKKETTIKPTPKHPLNEKRVTIGD